MPKKQDRLPVVRRHFTEHFIKALTYKKALEYQAEEVAKRDQKAHAATASDTVGHSTTPPDDPVAPAGPSLEVAQAEQIAKSQVASASAEDDPDDGPESVRVWSTAHPGFGARLYKSGKRTYVIQKRVGGSGKERSKTIGRLDVLTLADAWESASKLLGEWHLGKDPEAEKAAGIAIQAARRITLEKTYAKMVASNNEPLAPERRWTENTLENYGYLMRHYCWDIWEKPLVDVTPEWCATRFYEITKGTFEPAPRDRTQPAARGWAKPRPSPTGGYSPTKKHYRHAPTRAPTTANHVITVLRVFLEFAREATRQGGKDLILHVNPVDEMRRTVKPNNTKPREGRIVEDQVLNAYNKVKEVGELAEKEATRTGADCVQTRLLTGLRPHECRELRFSNIDFENNQIVVCEMVAKTGVERAIPMNKTLLALMRHRQAVHQAKHGQVPGPDDWVFPSPRSASGHIETTLKTLNEARSAVKGKAFTDYDLRRTTLDVGKACGANGNLGRRLLGHKPLDVHDAAYDNDPIDLEELMEKMEVYLERPAPPAESGAVAAVAAVANARVAAADNAPPTPDRRALLRAWRRVTREELVKLVWDQPTIHVAASFGVKDSAVGKRCKEWKIPKPGIGYWNKVHAHKSLNLPPPKLPKLS